MEKPDFFELHWIRFIFTVLIACLAIFAWLFWLPASVAGEEVPLVGLIKINEIDSDTPGSDVSEFIELFDGGLGNIPLDGFVLVFYNGATDASYRAVDLDRYVTDLGGYFLVGNEGVSGVDLTFPNNTLQNGADAVALYLGNASDFPSGTSVTTQNLIDAVVYGTSDPPDPGLLVLLNTLQTQVDENIHGWSETESLQRCPNYSGSRRDTNKFLVTVPTPGLPNCLPITMQAPALVQPGQLFTYTITVSNLLGVELNGVVITDTLPSNTSYAGVLDGGVFTGGLFRWTVPTLADREERQVRFRVWASEMGGVEIENRAYAVSAANFITPTFGIPFITAVDGNRRLIRSIQGAGHISSLNGEFVERVFGVVTAIRASGFYMQDPEPDSDPKTSEGIFVYTDIPPSVKVRDAVLVRGKVLEFRPGGTSSPNLTITEIVSPIILTLSSENQLPDPIVLGIEGQQVPGQIIDDDAQGDVEISGIFDPENDGIDFYESLEGMLVQIRDPVAVGPTDSEGRIAVIIDGGLQAGLRTPRGGIVVRTDDFNPERMIVDDVIVTNEPKVTVGTVFTGAMLGIIDYDSGNFQFLNTTPFPEIGGGVISETVSFERTENQITIATLNLENLDPTDNQLKFDRLAREIVFNLKAPDLIAVEEAQDNSGTVNDGVVSASLTFSRLILAIRAVGGLEYDYRQIDPVNNQDGGDPGGNIRQGFLFRTDRGLSFVDRPGGNAITQVQVIGNSDGIHLNYSPGRIEPDNSAFIASRKPLAGEFFFNGKRLFIIANHFNSKQGDEPLFGRYQPPSLTTQVKRIQQARIVNQFVNTILQFDPNEYIIVLGDLNDYPFSIPLQELAGGNLLSLVGELPMEEQYTYLFQGNSQAIDHILVSQGILNDRMPLVDIVHMNAEFLDSQRPTDHDPVVALLTLPKFLKTYLPFLAK